jgi:hypothetical protein
MMRGRSWILVGEVWMDDADYDDVSAVLLDQVCFRSAGASFLFDACPLVHKTLPGQRLDEKMKGAHALLIQWGMGSEE